MMSSSRSLSSGGESSLYYDGRKSRRSSSYSSDSSSDYEEERRSRSRGRPQVSSSRGLTNKEQKLSNQIKFRKKMIGPILRSQTTGPDKPESPMDRNYEEMVMDKETGVIVASTFEVITTEVLGRPIDEDFCGVYNDWEPLDGQSGSGRSMGSNRRQSSIMDMAASLKQQHQRKSFVVHPKDPRRLVQKEYDPVIKLCSCGTETNCGDRIENAISRFFYVVGKRIGTYPKMTIVWSMVLCLVCGIGLSMFQSESRPEKLWVPQDTRSDYETSKFDLYFGGNNRIDTMLISVDPDSFKNTNMLTKKKLLEAMKLQEEILMGYSETDDRRYNFLDLCLGGGGTCKDYSNAALNAVVEAFEPIRVAETQSPTDIGTTLKDRTSAFIADKYGFPEYEASTTSSSGERGTPTVCDCIVTGILGLWNYNSQILEDDSNFMETINSYGSAEDLSAVLGNPVFEDVSVRNDFLQTTTRKRLVSAEAIAVTYFLKDRSYVVKGETVDPINEDWEEQVFLANTKDANSNSTVYPSLRVDYFSSRSISDEFGGRLGDDIRFVIVSYFVAFLFVAMTIGSEIQCTTGSRWTLSLGVLGIVALSTIAGLGLSSAFGLVFGPVHSNLPFILLGIGVDDAFVIANAMDRERKVPRNSEDNDAIGKRAARALANAGSSITVTSATDFVAFAISAFSSIIPSLASFCSFAAISICLLWLFSSSFFTATLVLDERRQRDNRRECYCCFERQPNENCIGISVDPHNGQAPRRDARTPMSASPPPPKSSRPDDYNRSRSRLYGEDYYDDSDDDEERDMGNGHLRKNYDEIDARGFQEGKLSKYFRDYHGPIILSKWGKVVSLVVFLSLLVFGIFGASKLAMEDTSREFIPPDSYLVDYWEVADAYFPSEGIDFYIAFENTDGALDQDVAMVINNDIYKYRSDLANLDYRLKGLSQASPWIAEPSSASSYRNVMRGLKDYLDEFGTSMIGFADLGEDGWPESTASFYATLKSYVQPRAPGAVYSQDVAFNDAGIVEAIRIKSEYVRLVKTDPRTDTFIDDAERQIDGMEDTRLMVDDWTDLPSNRFVFCAKYFRIEGFKVIKAELIRNVVLAVVAVAIIVFVTLPSPMTAFLITVNVAFCLVEILGFMWALGIAIDTVSVINLILAVGLSVDYSAHIGHSFMMKGGFSKPKRVIEALADMGSAVLAGGMSTFLAVAVLLFLKSYVFFVLSRQLCLTVVLGLAHGLILLPIMLSILGPLPFGAASHPIYEAALEDDEDGNNKTDVPKSSLSGRDYSLEKLILMSSGDDPHSPRRSSSTSSHRLAVGAHESAGLSSSGKAKKKKKKKKSSKNHSWDNDRHLDVVREEKERKKKKKKRPSHSRGIARSSSFNVQSVRHRSNSNPKRSRSLTSRSMGRSIVGLKERSPSLNSRSTTTTTTTTTTSLQRDSADKSAQVMTATPTLMQRSISLGEHDSNSNLRSPLPMSPLQQRAISLGNNEPSKNLSMYDLWATQSGDCSNSRSRSSSDDSDDYLNVGDDDDISQLSQSTEMLTNSLCEDYRKRSMNDPNWWVQEEDEQDIYDENDEISPDEGTGKSAETDRTKSTEASDEYESSM